MSSGLLVPPDVGVDRLVADRELAVKAQVADLAQEKWTG